MRVGNLVKVRTKNNGDIIGVVVEKYFSNLEIGWIVQPTTPGRRVICSPIDMEVISEQR